MQNSLRMLRTVYAIMLVALGLYIYLPEMMHPHPSTQPGRGVFLGITGAAVGDVIVLFVMRRRIDRSVRVLATEPENKSMSARWRGGYIIAFVLCLAVALYGLVLRFIGFTLNQVAPFYVASVALMLYSFPRDPSEKAI